ncbi:DUF350 domain-containing protein [Oculatella sp. FACHB-28]|uniref:DUF350 domain-containing protein n=1 Tax=Cyanophyceae TaxID=3028117 RepID=UPI001686DF33|nr:MULTISPECIES: DUF350 domain-containing protein [Cyanophyceae]MBD1997360.1 DUF350 domain-containing protein [Leptolyngbya sp. FACHB-541]MBD2060618.1 DUF350 domain-containing protein [Oculatella sp. FACHB-28]MBD2068176.1 DUF350 domain-containing protein [Leptolyngbya sp. FACHB-671]
MLITVERVAATVGWALIGVLLLYAAIRLFDAVDPINYQTEIRQGNIAAGVVVAALIIATAAIIISVIVT